MAAESPEMETIQVSAEMLALVGKGLAGGQPWPTNPVAFVIDVSGFREPPTFKFLAHPQIEQLSENADLQRLIFLVASEACDRLRGETFSLEDGRSYLLTAELRAIGLSIRDCALPEAAALPYRLAKCIELFCEIIEADRHSTLIPVVGEIGCTLASSDVGRVAAAKLIIDERWNEPLTLEQIARECGINRSKLSRGFRELYGTSVADALSERRLEQARKSLLVTDLPVGLIGYRSGYQNNASFTRAFGRRFGVSPSELRSGMAS
jgi:AraC family transcriptional regulator, transcriptional activator of the genes for pyochelin and ferripyochelin receptors